MHCFASYVNEWGWGSFSGWSMGFYLKKMTHSFGAKNRSAFVQIACSKFLAYFEILTFKILAESKNTSFETGQPDNY